MSTNLRHLRSERVRNDSDALARSQVRLDRLLREQEEATAVLVAAQRAADDLARKTHQQRDLTNSLAALLAESRADLLQLCVANLPDDILRCIFEQVAADGTPHAPFAMASVCNRWRHVALYSPSIWSTIHLRRDDGTHPRNFIVNERDRVELLLLRSSAVPLDIKGLRHVNNGVHVDYMIFEIITLLGEHVSRWKMARLDIPVNFPSSIWDFLKGPTPLLVELTVSGHGYRTKIMCGDYLPFAPRLQYLSVCDEAGLGFATRHGFPAMKHLSFRRCACTTDQMLDVIRMSSQSLEELILCSRFDHGPSTPLHLPKLNYFCITLSSMAIISTPAPSIITPALVHLNLSSVSVLTDTYLPFLDAVSATVRRLTVEQPLSRRSLRALSHLRNIERLDFAPTFGPSFESHDALDLLCEDSAVWPRLECVRNLDFDVIHFDPSEAILRFIASRTGHIPTESESTGVTRPSRLREITMTLTTPRWLVAEVRRLLDS